ncbi:hypothetical protein RchiOBHm_Chr2g0157771 [Rosa chinensis]|uniref:Uncharacterized protein n=1 Tax=Rosa chinensis TaxID=74649 RepID=A0A2P6S1T9_ROSCH|nr:uncharacterized protein LOC112187823 [Rosa chinensis]PRQ52649.1 hypothetical protein RchiOBHm_Chr2g0157771 [Rosa chinensis]
MKKLYNKKGKVHPSPPPSTPDPFALLPATILTLTTALSVQDREVLAYLISYTNTNNNNNNNSTSINTNKANDAHKAGNDHPDPPMSQCDCFRCYKSFWARWDASPNRQLIHEIIEAYEEKLAEKKRRNPKVKKVRKKKIEEETKGNIDNLPVMKEELSNNPEVDVENSDGDEEGCEVEVEKGSSMRRLASFIGDRIWGVWN